MIFVKVDERFCKGCGLCVMVCSQGVLRINPEVGPQGLNTAGTVEGPVCKGCLRCTDMCPDAAIEIFRDE